MFSISQEQWAKDIIFISIKEMRVHKCQIVVFHLYHNQKAIYNQQARATCQSTRTMTSGRSVPLIGHTSKLPDYPCRQTGQWIAIGPQFSMINLEMYSIISR